MDFYDIDFEDEVLDALDAMNFRECTPIQEKTIVPLMEGHDLIGVAQTGTGKTAAYLLPVLNKLCRGGYPENAINCIIMAPTRELAQQIDRQLEGFTYFMPVPPFCCNLNLLWNRAHRKLLSHVPEGHICGLPEAAPYIPYI